jgi:nicotinamidase-related amidase
MVKHKSLDSRNLAILLIDMQERFLEYYSKKEVNSLVKAQEGVLDMCAVKNIPVAIIETFPFGETINPLKNKIKSIPRNKLFSKESLNGFDNPNLQYKLRKWQTKNIFLMGVYASQCVMETALGALKNKKMHIFTSEDVIDCFPDYGGYESKVRWYNKKGMLFNTHKDFYKFLK